MKKKLSKGFILFETILAFSIISFAILFFYRGSLSFLIESEERQRTLHMYRVLYEEVSSGRKQAIKGEKKTVNRGESFMVDYQLEGKEYAQITGKEKVLRISRME